MKDCMERGTQVAAVVALMFGVACADSHATMDLGPDAAPSDDGGRPDTGPPDLGRIPIPDDVCERALAGDVTIPCSPRERVGCGFEVCCESYLLCQGGVLRPESNRCERSSPDPACELTGPNATISVTIDGQETVLQHAYVRHGWGFLFAVDVTFTSDARAEVCAPQRLAVRPIQGFSGGSYNGVHEVELQWVDETGTPSVRFLQGTLTITSSDEIGALGPVAASLEATGDGIVITGTFDAADCDAWSYTIV